MLFHAKHLNFVFVSLSNVALLININNKVTSKET